MIFLWSFFLQNGFIVPYTTQKNYLEPWFEDGCGVRSPFPNFVWGFWLAISKRPTYWINGLHVIIVITPGVLCVSWILISAWVLILHLIIVLSRAKRLDCINLTNKFINPNHFQKHVWDMLLRKIMKSVFVS